MGAAPVWKGFSYHGIVKSLIRLHLQSREREKEEVSICFFSSLSEDFGHVTFARERKSLFRLAWKNPFPDLCNSKAPVEEAKRTACVFVQVSRFPPSVRVCVCPYWICLISLFLSCPPPHFLQPQQFFPLSDTCNFLAVLQSQSPPPPPNLWVLIAALEMHHLVLLLKVNDFQHSCVSCTFCMTLVSIPFLRRRGTVHRTDGRLPGPRLRHLQEHGRSLHHEDRDRPETAAR